MEWVEWVEWECNRPTQKQNSKTPVFTGVFFCLTKKFAVKFAVKVQ